MQFHSSQMKSLHGLSFLCTNIKTSIITRGDHIEIDWKIPAWLTMNIHYIYTGWIMLQLTVLRHHSGQTTSSDMCSMHHHHSVEEQLSFWITAEAWVSPKIGILFKNAEVCRHEGHTYILFSCQGMNVASITKDPKLKDNEGTWDRITVIVHKTE